MATGLERNTLAKAHFLIWDWIIFVNSFPDPITLTETVCICGSEAWNQFGFPNFADATPASSDQVCYH